MSRLSEKYGSKVSAKEAKAIQKAMDEQKENRNKFKEVPAGEYKVVVDKLELGETSWGDPQITLWFKITDGEFKNSRIFYNGSFDEHFSHGINVTAELLAEMLDDEDVTASMIAVILGHGEKETEDFLADCAETVENLAYDLDYQVKEGSVNPRTGKPYVNKYYTIEGVYDI